METTPRLEPQNSLDLKNNRFFTEVPFEKNESMAQYLRRRAESPKFHWSALVRTTLKTAPNKVYHVVHAPASCSVSWPEMGLVVPAYAIQDVNDPGQLLVVPQMVVEDGRFALEA